MTEHLRIGNNTIAFDVTGEGPLVVLAHGIGEAFTSGDVPVDAVEELLREEGCGA